MVANIVKISNPWIMATSLMVMIASNTTLEVTFKIAA